MCTQEMPRKCSLTCTALITGFSLHFALVVKLYHQLISHFNSQSSPETQCNNLYQLTTVFSNVSFASHRITVEETAASQ